VVEAAIWRYWTGSAWRDLPAEFGPWQTAWKRYACFARDGVWDRVLAVLLTEADAVGGLDWQTSVNSTITRAHQHATNTTREVVSMTDVPGRRGASPPHRRLRPAPDRRPCPPRSAPRSPASRAHRGEAQQERCSGLAP